MVRSMFSGVAGMKAHQTKMDVIGNNIANVNTFGFKSSRATFRDVYYQTMRGAAGSTSTKGGMNPSQVGYGSTIGSVDVMQTQSIMSTTGNPLDIAITGEGFLQVQDPDGNVYYTKAGMLDIDPSGNLVDKNGNFVLGTSGSPVGQAPGSNKIQFNIPAVPPKPGSVSDTINKIKYTVSASNNTDESNVKFTMISSSDLPIGQNVLAEVTSNGVVVKLNASATFTGLSDLNTKVNAAITQANGGKAHPAGNFTISSEEAAKFNGLTGAEICGTNFGVKAGTITLPTFLSTDNLFSIASVGDDFQGSTLPTFSVENVTAGNPPAVEATYQFKVTYPAGTGTPASPAVTYESEVITASQMKSANKVMMKNGTSSTDSFVLNIPSEKQIIDKLADKDATGAPELTGGKYTFADVAAQMASTVASVASAPAKDLGLSKGKFVLEGGTEGGPQTVNDLSGISIGADGVVKAIHPLLGDLEIGRIDLATFDNAAGLSQAGNTYFSKTDNSGDPNLNKAGTGGTGALAQSALEMSNVDLSQEFADMITTQRGFQANSRLITVSDTMLEELINLKR